LSSPWRSSDDEPDADQGDAGEYRNRSLRGLGWEDELEQRDGITEPTLERSERTVAASNNQRCAFKRERDH